MAENIYDTQNTDDKKNIVQLRAGTAEQSMINAAYMGARSKPNMMEHMNLLDHFLTKTKAGYTATKAVYEAKKEAERAELEALMKDIETDANNVINMSGSLPKGYFNKVYSHVEGLRNEYAEAKRSGDEQKAAELRMQLNTLSTNIGSFKEGVLNNAQIINGNEGISDLSVLSLSQQRIVAACKEENAQFVDGEIVWDNPRYKPQYLETDDGEQIENPEYDPNEKQYFTLDDYNKSVVSKDYVFKESYLTLEKEMAQNGEMFRNGTSTEDFNENNQYKLNLDKITKENIQYLLRDDFNGDMTFEQSLDQHPDMMKFFDFESLPVSEFLSAEFDDKDIDGDGVLDYTGEIDEMHDENTIFSETYLNSPSNIIKYDTDGNKIVTWEDFGSTPEEARTKLIETITQPDARNFDFNLSRGLVADFMTKRQKQLFYKNTKPFTLNEMVAYNKKDVQDFIDDGGSIGQLKALDGVTVDKKNRIRIDLAKFNSSYYGFTTSTSTGNSR